MVLFVYSTLHQIIFILRDRGNLRSLEILLLYIFATSSHVKEAAGENVVLLLFNPLNVGFYLYFAFFILTLMFQFYQMPVNLTSIFQRTLSQDNSNAH